MAVFQHPPTKGEKETDGEDILREGDSNGPAHQSFEEALFGWSWVLKDSDESLPLSEERWHLLIVLVIYMYTYLPFFLYE